MRFIQKIMAKLSVVDGPKDLFTAPEDKKNIPNIEIPFEKVKDSHIPYSYLKAGSWIYRRIGKDGRDYAWQHGDGKYRSKKDALDAAYLHTDANDAKVIQVTRVASLPGKKVDYLKQA